MHTWLRSGRSESFPGIFLTGAQRKKLLFSLEVKLWWGRGVVLGGRDKFPASERLAVRIKVIGKSWDKIHRHTEGENERERWVAEHVWVPGFSFHPISPGVSLITSLLGFSSNLVSVTFSQESWLTHTSSPLPGRKARELALNINDRANSILDTLQTISLNSPNNL